MRLGVLNTLPIAAWIDDSDRLVRAQGRDRTWDKFMGVEVCVTRFTRPQGFRADIPVRGATRLLPLRRHLHD